MSCTSQNEYFLSVAWIILNCCLFSLHLHHLLPWDETISSYTAQYSTKSRMMDICWGRMAVEGVVVGVGEGGGGWAEDR